MLAPDDGAERILTFLIMVVGSDTGGYVAGVLFGKHPMAPTISPEEVLGGLRRIGASAAMLGGALTVWLMLGGQWWQGLIIGAAVARRRDRSVTWPSR